MEEGELTEPVVIKLDDATIGLIIKDIDKNTKGILMLSTEWYRST